MTDYDAMQEENSGMYVLFSYWDRAADWFIRGVYNTGTEEFSVRVDIGMLEFALIEFITDDFAVFRAMAEQRLPGIIRTQYAERQRHFSVMLREKGVPYVGWDSFLPQEYKGFKRLIKPNDAVRIINGSYMILSYYHKPSQSGLALMYNFLRDDFFAERRVHNIPNLVHDFDSRSLDELQQALQERLLPVLDGIYEAM